MTKTELSNAIALAVDVPRSTAVAMLDKLAEFATAGLRGESEFTIPGIVKLVVKRKPATKARQGRNPATGEPMMIKAKPAHDVVKARVAKALVDEATAPRRGRGR